MLSLQVKAKLIITKSLKILKG